MEFVILLICGGAIGFFSSFFGIGGGALIVPVLYSLYPNVTDTVVISTSLGTIFFITLINSYNFYLRKLTPPKKIIFNFLITASIGALLGSKFTYLIDTQVSKKIIAIILLVIVAKNLFYKVKLEDHNVRDSHLNIALTGFFGSFISAISGLGGGVIFVPMLMSLVKLPPKRVSPYSNVAMVFATSIGAIPHLFTSLHNHNQLSPDLNNYFLGQINYLIVLLLAVSAYFTSKLGVKFNDLVSETNKKNFLALVLLSLSLKMFFV